MELSCTKKTWYQDSFLNAIYYFEGLPEETRLIQGSRLPEDLTLCLLMFFLSFIPIHIFLVKKVLHVIWSRLKISSNTLTRVGSILELDRYREFGLKYLTNYFYEAPRQDSNLGPKAFSLLEFEIVP